MNIRLFIEGFAGIVIGVLSVTLFSVWTERLDLERAYRRVIRKLVQAEANVDTPSIRVMFYDPIGNLRVDNTHKVGKTPVRYHSGVSQNTIIYQIQRVDTEL